MAMVLPTYIPLDEAVSRYRLSAPMLTQMIEKGTIKAVRINGSLAVAETDIDAIALRDELRAQVKHLNGVPIGVNDAAKKYNLSTGSLTRWIAAGYIRTLSEGRPRGRGRKRFLNESDVAYARLLVKHRRGHRVFTKELIPDFTR